MPIARETEESGLPKPAVDTHVAPEVRTNVVDTDYTPTNALITAINGSPWTVDYYSQVLGADNAVSGQQVGLSAALQQFKKINGLVLRVTSALTTSFDNETKSMIVTGSATTLPFLKPNDKDLFTAVIDDGRVGLFEITNTERKSYFKETTYVIEYILVGYLDDTRKRDLESKVVKNLYYVDDFALHGQRPFVEEAEYFAIRDLKRVYFELADLFLSCFISREFGTLIIPLQDESTYDPFLTEFAIKIIGYDSPKVPQIRKLNCGEYSEMQSKTVWDLLASMDANKRIQIATEAGFVSVRRFNNKPIYEGISFTGIEYVVVPRNPTFNVDNARYGSVLIESETSSIKTSMIPSDALVPIIHPVSTDGHYVFSKAFYEEHTEGQSLFELLLNKTINNQAVDILELSKVVKDVRNWGYVEQFYYLPALIALIKCNIRSM